MPLHTRVKRDVLYANLWFPGRDPIVLPVGELLPSTTNRAPGSVTIAVTEHLEAENTDGSASVLVATSGDELIDDLATVLSFGLNSIFSRDRDLVTRLVPSSPERRGGSAATLFRGTFDQARPLKDEELDDLVTS